MRTLAISSEVENILSEVLARRANRQELRKPVTQSQLRHAVRLALERSVAKVAAVSEGREPEPFQWVKYCRGVLALRGEVLNRPTCDADIAYAQRTLVTTAPSGSYLVPTIAAESILAPLAQYAAGRVAGATIWEMRGEQRLTVPAVVTSPAFIWMAQTSRQSSADFNAAQLVFDLSMCQALCVLPTQLFKTAHPSFDAIMSDGFAVGAAEAEDAAMFATSTVSNGPLALASQSSITTLTPGNGANGGALAYSDLLAVIQKASDLKVRPPYAWFMNGRTWLRCLSLASTTSQPILSVFPEGDGPQVGHLLGWPVYATASIPTNQSVGSGSNQSSAIFTNPRAIHIGESGDFRWDVSYQFALDSDEVALRLQHQVAFQYQPSASIIVLQGIN